MDTPRSKIIYALTFIVSFFIFLMFTFPFSVLKDTISQKASEATGLNISMEAISPNIPFGINVEGLVVQKNSSKKIRIEEIDVDLKFLSLFAGKIGGTVTIDNGKNGSLDVDVSIPMGGLFAGNPIPSFLSLEAEKFSLTDILAFAMDHLAASPTMDPFIAPMLKQVRVESALSANVNIDLDTSDPKNSDGAVDIKLLNLNIKSLDPSIDLVAQKFKKAQIIAKLSAGNFRLDPKSSIDSDQIGFGFSGSIGLKNPIQRSNLMLDVSMNLKGALKDTFGSYVATLLLKTDPTTWDGNATLQLAGTLAFPTVNPILQN